MSSQPSSSSIPMEGSSDSTLGSAAMNTDTQSAGSTYGTSQNGTGKGSSASLREDLQNLKQELDSLLPTASSMSDTELQEAHARLMAKFSTVRYAAKGVAAEATRQLNRSVDMTTDYVKDKPMQSVAIAAGAGILMGMILGRR